MKNNIVYVKGDATDPDSETDIMITFHICNDINLWGAGFVLAVSDTWPLAKEVYHHGSKELGSVSIANVEPDLYVANMIAQHGVKWTDGVPPIRYDALRKCLTNLNTWAQGLQKDGKKVSFHGPRMGAGLAGGDWKVIEKMIGECLSDFPVYIYDL